jgi:hypothetical protein
MCTAYEVADDTGWRALGQIIEVKTLGAVAGNTYPSRLNSEEIGGSHTCMLRHERSERSKNAGFPSDSSPHQQVENPRRTNVAMSPVPYKQAHRRRVSTSLDMTPGIDMPWVDKNNNPRWRRSHRRGWNMLRKWQALSAEGLHGEQQDVATEDPAQQAARHQFISPDNQYVVRCLVCQSRSDGVNRRTARASCPNYREDSSVTWRHTLQHGSRDCHGQAGRCARTSDNESRNLEGIGRGTDAIPLHDQRTREAVRVIRKSESAKGDCYH